ncbi:hypothetical protein DL89DRAFT_266245 [Linderina pennispora]|uniref:F-box domain-containing protein n=1 Tax=Linderina pennispora TaxID=61395 RepID=A0A1Y1WDJ2_9FUNG|nr:uncharacterized protein DL89DRAFT_266245 [Linderina pennispora]ORX71234.1 hypothetical protein DL89DRAFT_266245 [Linderina pennispora]
MASSHSLSQNIPADILGLVFLHVEDGDTLTGLWERSGFTGLHCALFRSCRSPMCACPGAQWPWGYFTRPPKPTRGWLERAEVHLDDQIARLSARLRELFPNSRAISFFALQNLEDCEVEAFYGLASKSSASPHSLIYRSRSPCSSTLLAPNLTSLRRIHISSPTSSAAARLIRASSKSLEELRLYKPSPEALEEIIAYKEPHRYPSLKKLTLYCTNFTDVKGVKEDAVIFPALTHLALIDCYRIASFDILVRGATSTLTHLSFNMTNMAIAGLRNHRFLNLKRVCVLTCGSIKSENPTYEVGDTIRLPFEIAPSAEAIEFYGYLDDLPPNIPDALLDCGISFSLSYLCLHQTNFTISQIGQLLVHADMVIRLTVNNIIAVNDKEMAVPDKFIEEFLTNGEPFSRRLTRLDVCIKRTHPATLILAITKLPSLSRVCLSCYTPQFYIADLMDELERPVFQEHRHHVHRVSLGTTRYSTSSFNPDRL